MASSRHVIYTSCYGFNSEHQHFVEGLKASILLALCDLQWVNCGKARLKYRTRTAGRRRRKKSPWFAADSLDSFDTLAMRVSLSFKSDFFFFASFAQLLRLLRPVIGLFSLPRAFYPLWLT